MGEAPNLRNFFVAAGFNSLGILSGGGVGFVMAEWLVDGRPPMDVWSVNLRRMHAWQDNRAYLLDRTRESLGIGYQDHWPFRQWSTARGVKKSILHDRLAAAGACFGESAGWERPNWYASPGQTPDTPTAGSARTGSCTMRPSTAPCANASGYSSSPRSRSCWSRGGMPRRC